MNETNCTVINVCEKKRKISHAKKKPSAKEKEKSILLQITFFQEKKYERMT